MSIILYLYHLKYKCKIGSVNLRYNNHHNYFLILVGFLFLFSINSVTSQDHGFFVIPEDVYDNSADYSLKSSLSSIVEKFENGDGSDKENDEQLVGSENSSDFNFALVGNWGCTKHTKKTVDLIQNQNPDIVFSFGDTSYRNDINCWEDIVKPISDKMKVIIGNHDVMSPDLLKQHMEAFGLDKQYYSLDYHNNIHFLIMDSM